MACTDCIEVKGLPFPCLNKAAGGFETKIWFIPMCELDRNPFIDTYAVGVIDDILVLPGKVFREIVCVRDSIKLAYPNDTISRMVDTALAFDVAHLTNDSDRTLAVAAMRAFLQAMIDSPEQMCFIVQERQQDDNVPVRRVLPNLDIEPFASENGGKAEDAPKTTLNYKKRSRAIPFVLDPDYVIPV